MQRHSTPGATSPRQDEDDNVPERSDEALTDLSKPGYFMQVHHLCWGDLLCPQGSQSPRAQAGAWQLGPVCAWHHVCHQWGDGHSPVPPSPSAPASSKLQKKKNNKIPKPHLPLCAARGVGRVTKLIKSMFFLLDEGFTFTSVKKCPRSKGLDPSATNLQSLHEECPTS